MLEVRDELGPIRQMLFEWKPHVVFNLIESFFGLRELDQHVASYLELLRVPYTGCNPRGLVLARDKALAKTILTYHRIHVPRFEVVHSGRRVRRSKRLTFPLIVKSLTEEASVGIAQASVVWDQAELDERVKFIHESITGDALIEEFIDGREIYVGRVREQAADGAAAVGAVLREDGTGGDGDRDGAREAQPRLSGQARDHRGRSRPRARGARRS